MSYSYIKPCWNCFKAKTQTTPEGEVKCTDFEVLQEAITKIHSNGVNHQGGGSIVLMCDKQNK